MITDAGLALASWLLCLLVLVLSLLALAHWNARPVAVVEDPTPLDDEVRDLAALRLAELRELAAERRRTMPDYPDDEPPDPVLAVDPPVVPAYIPPVGMVLYRGGAVHPACARSWLRDDIPPCAGCAVWLTDSLKASTP